MIRAIKRVSGQAVEHLSEAKQKYIFLPEQVCFDKRLPPLARLLYGVIAALTKDGYCWARNSFLADKFHVRPETISKAVSALEEAGYIRLEFEGQGKENRRIYTLDKNVIPYDENLMGTHDEKVIPYDKKVKDPCEKSQGTLDENVKQINIYDNYIESVAPQAADAPTPSRKKRCFKPPTLEEVTAYCRERENSIDPERFLNYYESNGWMVGRTKMKNWKAAVRTWEAKDKPSTPKPQRKNLEWTTDENGERVAVYAD